MSTASWMQPGQDRSGPAGLPMPLSSAQMVLPFCALKCAHIWSASWYVSILLTGLSLPALLTHPVGHDGARHRSAGLGIAAHAAAEALHQAKRLVDVKPDRRRQRASDRLRAIEALLEIRHRLRFARIVVKFQNRLFRHGSSFPPRFALLYLAKVLQLVGRNAFRFAHRGKLSCAASRKAAKLASARRNAACRQ